MKKIIPIVFALALTLSMASMAWAGVGVGNPGSVNGENKGSTAVNVEVNSANLSVTVPLNMTIVAPVNGGTCAVPGSYQFVNNGVIVAHVASIQVADAQNGLVFSDTEVETTDTDEVSIALNGVQLTTAELTDGLTAFNIPAKSSDGVGSYNMTIVAKSGQLTSATTQDAAFTITFTVAPGAAA